MDKNSRPGHGLPEKYNRWLEKENLQTAEQILAASVETFRKYGATEDEIDLIYDFYGRKLFSGFIKASECESKWAMHLKRISFGCTSLDQITKNGIPIQGITEIYGEAGSGKSQLCMQLSLMVQLPECYGGLGKDAAYICTESVFPTKRLQELIEAFQERYKNVDIKYENHVHIKHCNDAQDLLSSVSNPLRDLLEIHKIGLIVIDSVAGVFRSETNYSNRAKDLRKLIEILLNYSNRYNCAIVCVNQVSSVIDDSNTINSNRKLIPCLGLAWSNLLNTRIQIHRTNETFSYHIPKRACTVSNFIRIMEILFSSELPKAKAEFFIMPWGICNVNGDIKR